MLDRPASVACVYQARSIAPATEHDVYLVLENFEPGRGDVELDVDPKCSRPNRPNRSGLRRLSWRFMRIFLCDHHEGQPFRAREGC